MRQVQVELLERLRDEQARTPKSPEWEALEAELEANGFDVSEFAVFTSVVPTTFDYDAAAPMLVDWLPRVRDPVEKEVIARALTATKSASAAAARARIAEFRRLPIDDDDIAGHAISGLRSYGPKSALPHLRRARPKLEAVLARPTATPLAKRQARKAMERLDG